MSKTTNPHLGHRLTDLSVLVVLASLVVWYCLDAWNASTHILNLILILPLTCLVLLLCGIEFIRQLIVGPSTGDKAQPVRSALPVIGLFVAYTLSLPWLGFDIGTFLFIAVFLWINGERRWFWILGYSLCFASISSLFFAAMLPYPMPMSVFPS